jgi:histidinol-phosphatase (PHP family)
MKFLDSHMHTPLCRHAIGQPEEYAEVALEAGLGGITFTCHNPMPRGFWPRVRMAEDDFPLYVEMVARAREAYAGRLDIRLGLECDFFPGMESYVAKQLEGEDFHHVLGSVHWQGPEYGAAYLGNSVQEAYDNYFELLARSAESGLFDTLSHPDLVKNYQHELWDWRVMEKSVLAALDRIAVTGVAMELNTSGAHKISGEVNPGPEMLAAMAERGIPVVIGSDAHVPRRVGEGFGRAFEMLEVAGYERVSYFVGRRRTDVALREARGSLVGCGV